MILFFRFLILFFCLFSFSQGLLTKPLLVKKDSVSFYSFTNQGVTHFQFNDLNKLSKKHVNYSVKIPKSLEAMGVSSLSAISKGDVVYFLYPGGGVLYKFKDGVIERIDESFPHRSQFSGHFFMYNENLYLLGGYGYWESKSHLTKFNFQNGSWDFVQASGQIPSKGINQGSFVIKENLLYVFNFYETSADSSEFNANLFTLNLDSFLWTKKGPINSLFENDIEKSILSVKIPYKESLIHKNFGSLEFQLINPFLNSIKNYKTNSPLYLDENSILVGDRLAYLSLDAERLNYSIVVKDFNELFLLSSEETLYNDAFVFKAYLVFAGSLLLILIVFVFVYFKKTTKAIYLSSDSLFTEEKAVSINKDQRIFLKLLANSQNGIVENSLILNYFKDDAISLDAAIKRKGKMINLLNKKFFNCFGIFLIKKSVDPKDSRQVSFSLNSSIELVQQEN